MLICDGRGYRTQRSEEKRRRKRVMGSATSRIGFRIVMVALLLLFLFYIGRPLYWKISATVHDIRNNKQTVRQGLSQIVMEAQKSVGWYHDDTNSGLHATNRKLLLLHHHFSK